MRKRLYLLFAVSIIIFLAACANSDNTEQNGDGGSDGDTVTLELWNRYPEIRGPFDTLISNFEEEHPNIKINKQDLPLDSHQAQLQTAISSRELPDMFTTAADLVDLVDNDLVKNLDEFFTDDVRGMFHEGTWWESGTTLNGSAYVFPFLAPQTGAFMLYYNKDVLEQLGISEDEIPATWEEFRDIGERILDESGGSISPLAWNNEGWSNEGLINMMGTAISPEAPEYLNFKDGEPAFYTEGKLESAEFLKELYDSGIVAQNAVEVSTMDAEAHFAVGANAFWISGQWTGNQLIDDHNFTNWGVAPLPTKDGSPYYQVAARQADGLQVSSDTEHWEEVQIFLEYALDNLHQTFYVETGLGIPAKEGVGGDPAFEQQNDIIDIQLEYAIPIPKPAQVNLDTIQFEKDYTSALEYTSIGDAVVGYLSGAVDDIEAELQMIDEEAKEVFSQLLEENADVSREDFTFPNWVPFEPFTEADYES